MLAVMRLPQLSIADALTTVGIIALNCAAIRAIHGDDDELLCGVAPMALALQVGIFWLIRSRSRVRAFWVGFLVFGAVAMTSFVGAWFFCAGRNVSVDPRTGILVDRWAGSPIWVLWSSYGRFVGGSLQHLTNSELILGDGGDTHGHDGVPIATKAAILAVPQVAFAVAGAALTSLTLRWRFEPDSRTRDHQKDPTGGARLDSG
jgi:hypothetical protein